ncbi:GspH/FimT family pseudopilin [Hydrogenophaga sp.]|uniref:GspH/FimT family pseudopilin n=1 Tax=Hydrogenophaga sp. TaxID=1904254 RepID=UPI0026176C79|nr:GspH/FimT family pseudopilin [Hydrogenophaga sp.]MCW5654106.1 GspH/FimT family pseudopilin [Hydrogenophaga sp.]
MKHSFTCSPGHRSTAQAGFTLIELMVGVAIMAIILAFGVPSFQSAIASNRLTGTTNDLVSAMALARTEAIRRGTRVTLCKSANATQCTNAGQWTQGWIVFVDTTRSSTDASVDTGETILASQAASPPNIALKGTADVANFISFGADGRPKLMNGAAQSGFLQVCSTVGALADSRRARDVEITAAGRVITHTPSSVSASCPDL